MNNADSKVEIRLDKSNKILFLIPFIIFVGLVLLLYSQLGKDPTMLESQLVGKSIPEFRKTDLLDEKVLITDADLKGPALINVFASWCPSCYNEHPHYMKLSKSNENVHLYGLNYKDTRTDGLKFINDLGNPYERIIFDENGRLGIDLGVYGAPETFVINENNKIIYRHVGIVSDKVWKTKIKPMLERSMNRKSSATKSSTSKNSSKGELE